MSDWVKAGLGLLTALIAGGGVGAGVQQQSVSAAQTEAEGTSMVLSQVANVMTNRIQTLEQALARCGGGGDE